MRGIDPDLESCLNYNPQPGFDLEWIDAVLAVWEGQNEGDYWRWVLRLMNGLHVFLVGGCDYTGWDCESWANSYHAPTAESAAAYALTEGLSGYAYPDDVHKSLLDQIAQGKRQTWAEKTDKEMGDQTSG